MENKIKIGDFVRLQDSISNPFGHHLKEAYEVVGLENDNSVLVLKNYLSSSPTSKIHESFFVIDINETRRRKLEKLFK